MGIDLLNLKPSVISRDLKGKYVCIYSQPKMGKTTLACQFPRNLLLGFEHGWNAIAGAMAVDITSWSDFKLALRQLALPQAKEMYDTITIDTVAIAWQLCEDYICTQNAVQKIGDIPFGGGYAMVTKEFENALRSITQLGYGLVIIAHVATRKEKQVGGAEDNQIEIVAPKIPTRCYDIVNQIVDIIGYINLEWDENGQGTRWVYTRKTPTVMAGSRFKYLAPKIKFGYTELSEAIGDAIDEEAKHGATVVDHAEEVAAKEQLDFLAIRKEAGELWNKLVGTGDNIDADMGKRILKKIEMVFGRKMKLSEITEDQVELFNLVLTDMRDLEQEKNS